MAPVSAVPNPACRLLRRIPQVDRLLLSAEFAELRRRHPRELLLREVRATLEELRGEAGAGALAEADLEAPAVRRRVEARLAERLRPYYRPVINATGVILHTGLGRAPLAAEAITALTASAGRAQRLEIDLESGLRGGREAGCAALLCELSGGEAATVVNNNAAATLLILSALARGREVLLSRGELVEIGGSYRIPEILRESGAVLREVGTTNRTHERDYRQALTPETGLILKVHASNYRIEGFTAEVDVAGLAALGREHGVPVVHDLGSGCLVDLAPAGGAAEPRVQESLRAGADLVCFSGDKLLGGPQAGLIVGRRDLVGTCRRHPLFRAMRPGRLIYTALEATLRLYLEGDERAWAAIPALHRLAADEAELERRAADLAERLTGLDGYRVSVVACDSQAGSGSLPARGLPSRAVRVEPTDGALEALAAALRAGEPPILARTQEGALLFDLRTVADDELPQLAARLREIAAGG